MLTVRLAAGAALLLALGAAPVPPDKVQEEKEKLRGTWKLVAREADGKAADAEDLKGITYQVTDDKVVARQGGEGAAEYPYRLDPGKAPKEIDLFVPGAMLAGAHHQGIYRLKGDRLEICWAEAFNAPRPKELKGGPGHTLIVLERRKP
jgi:uncharacterized protein (TIGR03067 family)